MKELYHHNRDDTHHDSNYNLEILIQVYLHILILQLIEQLSFYLTYAAC